MGNHGDYPRTQHVGIFVFDGFEPIDVWGFAEAFTVSRFLGTGYAAGPPYPFEVVLIAKDLQKVKSFNGPHVTPTTHAPRHWGNRSISSWCRAAAAHGLSSMIRLCSIGCAR